MIVHEFRQLLAQALVLFALMTKQDGALEQTVLQFLRQFAPKIRGGCAKNQKIAGGDVVDDLIRVMLRHDGTLTLLLRRRLMRCRSSGTSTLGRDGMPTASADIEPCLP
jgi:hypothetical protein